MTEQQYVWIHFHEPTAMKDLDMVAPRIVRVDAVGCFFPVQINAAITATRLVFTGGGHIDVAEPSHVVAAALGCPVEEKEPTEEQKEAGRIIKLT